MTKTADFSDRHSWRTAFSGPRALMPRSERCFLSLPTTRESTARARLRIEGRVLRAWINGHPLEGKGNLLEIPDAVLRPWENEFRLDGWPRGARLEADGEPAPFPPSVPAPPGGDAAGPLERAGAALAAFRVADGPDAGDMFSFYDPRDRTFRLPRWRWDTGICLEALARLYERTGHEPFRECALAVARRMAAVRIADPDCPGGFPETMDLHMTPARSPRLGDWVAPFNGAFIGAGLLAAADIADAADAERFRAAAAMADVLMISRGMTADGRLRGYFHMADRRWRYHGQINDSAIYPRLVFERRRRGENVDVPAATTYARSISKLIRPEGYLGRARFVPDSETWPAGVPLFPEWRKAPDRIPAKIFARGQGWGLLGLAAAWRMTGDEGIAQGLRRIADYLLDRQDGSGLWRHDLGRPESGFCAKSTAVIGWALLEAREARGFSGGDGRLTDAVGRAREALRENQRRHMDGPLPGALMDENEEGAIIYFRDRPMSTAYATGAFILMELLGEEEGRS
jgi:hypothetical protein